MKHTKYTKLLKLTILALIIISSSCISQKSVTMLQDSDLAIGSTFDNSKKITHHVQTGDHLYIKIYSVDPKTSKFFQSDIPALVNSTYVYLNSYVVDEQGYISFSFVDKMFVKGLTIDEVRNLVQKTLNDYFKETTVVVRLANFQIAVLGEVGSPGNFTIDKEQVNIFQALGLAGGLKDFSNIKEVKIVRQTLKGSEVFTVNLSNKEILQSDYFYLMPNDIVYVAPRGSKSWLFDKFPYATVFSVLSLGVSLITLFKII